MGAWAGVDVEERVLAGRVCGTLWAVAAVTVSLFVVLPGIDHAHRDWVLSLAAGSLVWGLAQALVIPWRRVPGWLLHLSVLAGFAVIAALVASSGASKSPGWIYLFFVAVFASYFFQARAALVVMAGCVLVQAAPIVYDHNWTHTDYTGELVIAAPAYFAFGVSVLLGKALMRRHRARAEMLAGEQAALRRVATAVIGGEPPEVIYALVARECAARLGAGAAGVLRFDEDDAATVMGSWADHEGGSYASGTVIEVRPGSDIAQARDLNVPVRIEGHAPGSPVANLGYTASIVCPVMVGGRAWGAVVVAASEPSRLTGGD